jgi:hypothetical protein
MDWCCMCKKSGKTHDYLLFQCYVARDLWNMVFQMFGVALVMPIQVMDLLTCWKGRVGQNDMKIVWNVIPSCLMWCIWREMSTQSFDDCEKTSSDLHYVFLNPSFSGFLIPLLFEWISSNAFLNVSNLVDLCTLGVFSCIFCVLGSLVLFNELDFTYKKKLGV